MEEEKEWQESEVDGDHESFEKAALVRRSSGVSNDDAEQYSSKRFFKARSFKIGLLASLLILIVIAVAICIAGVATALVSRNNSHVMNTLTLDDVFDEKFRSKRFSGSWIGDRIVTKTSEDGVTLYQPSTGQEILVISPEELNSLEEQLGSVSVRLSPAYLTGGNSAVVLLAADVEDVYRHSTMANYYLYSKSYSPELWNVTKPDHLVDTKFQYVEWSPNGEKLAYVIDYNVYVLGIIPVDSVPIPITTSGSKNGIIYGIPDWVYEEEVLSDDHALWWSPDSESLLFVGFDDTGVHPYSFPIYGNQEELYDSIETISYPKPGTSNPLVTVYVTNVNDPQPNNFTLLQPETLAQIDHYLAYAGWVDGTHPYVAWLNRTQTYIEFCAYSFANESASCDLVYKYNAPQNGWIEQYGASQVMLSSDSASTSLLTLLPRDADDDSSTHLAMVRSGEADPTFLTGPGLWEVTDIVGHAGDSILYVSAEEGPSQRHLYSYYFPDQKSTCLSCDQSTWEIPDSPNQALPSHCSYFTVSCDSLLNSCLLHCNGPCVPYSILANFNKPTQQLQDIKVMEVNPTLRDAIAPLDLPIEVPISVPATDGPELYGQMLLPPGFRNDRKYPVLMYVYGGPASQVVSESSIINSLSHLYYVSNLNIILASVDGRGTGFRGNNFKFPVYKRLGLTEVVDQERAGSYLQSLEYVDGNNMAIYGSSYGGYMAGMVGTSERRVFSAAISQSPVSDWHYYDSIYTERYMLQPSENGPGYEESSILPRVKSLDDVDYLLIHGTADDNVHYQHTAQLAEALTQSDVQFRMQVYTDKEHSLIGGNTRRHLYQLITDFLEESFKL